jgi:hypothetical protein
MLSATPKIRAYRFIMIWPLLGLGLVALGGCTSLARQHLEAQSRESCINDWGLKPGTPAFGACYSALVAQGQTQFDAEMTALANGFATSNQQMIEASPPAQTLNLNILGGP